jgi:hypothetical protein
MKDSQQGEKQTSYQSLNRSIIRMCSAGIKDGSSVSVAVINHHNCAPFKGIGLSYFSKMAWKLLQKKKLKIISEVITMKYIVCTAVARCFPNILDVIVLENIKMSWDKIWRLPWWSNEIDFDSCHLSATWDVSSVYFNRTLIPYVNRLWGV